METTVFENNSQPFSKDLLESELKIDTFSNDPSQNRASKSPLSRGTVSPKYFSTSYQRASQISPTLDIQSKLYPKQVPDKINQNNYQKTQFAKHQESNFNQNQSDFQIGSKNKVLIKDPIKQIANLKSKIKEEQFLIELQNAVHKELMSILSKKDKSLASLKTQKLDQNTCYEIQQQTQAYLDKAECYVKEMKKLQDIAERNQS